MAREERQVRCINKPGDHFNEHQRIERIGGREGLYDWTFTEDEAIALIETNAMSFFTMVQNVRAEVKVAGPKTLLGNKYLTTNPDDFRKNNLLYLPECPR